MGMQNNFEKLCRNERLEVDQSMLVEMEHILEEGKFWKSKNGKACGMDGWPGEIWQALTATEFGLQMSKKFIMVSFYFAVLPRYCRTIKLSCMLKPGKPGVQHNDYRKLSVMSEVRKKRRNWHLC